MNELIIVNNLGRFASGEQKQAVGNFAFYLQILGAAALPWVALAPVATFAGLRAYERPSSERGVELQRFALLWLAVSLFAIGFATTKYNHYLLACLPPLAVLVGVWLDRAMSDRDRSTAAIVRSVVGIAILAFVVRDLVHAPASIAHLTTYLYTGMWLEGAPTPYWLAGTAAVFALGLAARPVAMDPDRKALAELVEEKRGQGASLWFITTIQHANRVGAQLPPDVRAGLEEVYANFHYALLRAPVP